jgi:DNA helicase HerA-like ATPase
VASEIADQLRAAILFEGPNGKARVSVINLSELAGDDARDSFVNRLQMSLFTFVKRNPNPTGYLYVIDEAQEFAPSGAATACKASALSLAAQARKYGLGIMFATHPRAVLRPVKAWPGGQR